MAINSKPGAKKPTQQQTHEQIARPTAAESKRLHVPIPPDLYRRMKRQAVDEDRTMAEITRELWEQYLGDSDG